MAEPIIASLPAGIVLGDGMTVRLNAISAADGSAVTGVTVTSALLLVRNIGTGADLDLSTGPFLLVPGPGA